MNVCSSAVALLILLASLTACRQSNQVVPPPGVATNPAAARTVPAFTYQSHAQTNLNRIKLFVGSEELHTELALTPTQIMTGMMWRTNMAENEAMLFAFTTPEPRSFYMRNTYVPLSVAYIDPEGIILEIHDLQPLNETPVPSRSDNIQYVLEVKQGWFARHQVGTGALVRSQFGDLKQTFRPAR